MQKYLLTSVCVLVLVIGVYFSVTRFQTKNQSQHQNTTSQITTSNLAIQIVSNLPEVKRWEQLFSNPDGTSPKTNGRPVIALDSETSTIYVVHVYEDASGHTATFGWYDVDKNKGTVTKENL
jgi:hypothetical protein